MDGLDTLELPRFGLAKALTIRIEEAARFFLPSRQLGAT